MIWDWLVIVLFFLQLIGLAVVGYMGWLIYQGPVGKATVRGKQLAKSVFRTGGVIKKNYEGKEGRVVALAQKAFSTYEDTNRAVKIPDMPISYRSLLSAWGSIRLARSLFSEGAKLFKPAPPPGPVGAKRGKPSLAHQMGLIPPILNRLGRATPFLRMGIGAFRELRRRGIF